MSVLISHTVDKFRSEPYDKVFSEYGPVYFGIHDFDDEKFVVFTGGEPLLQLNSGLIDALHQKGFKVAIETNGTLLPPENIDWICVSPKKGAKFKLKYGNE